MSTFYGTLLSDKGKPVNKTGNEYISAVARTYQGSIAIDFRLSETDEIICELHWQEGESTAVPHSLLYYGPVKDLITIIKRGVELRDAYNLIES